MACKMIGRNTATEELRAFFSATIFVVTVRYAIIANRRCMTHNIISFNSIATPSYCNDSHILSLGLGMALETGSRYRLVYSLELTYFVSYLKEVYLFNSSSSFSSSLLIPTIANAAHTIKKINAVTKSDIAIITMLISSLV